MMGMIRIVPFLFASSALYRPNTPFCRTMATMSYHEFWSGWPPPANRTPECDRCAVGA